MSLSEQPGAVEDFNNAALPVAKTWKYLENPTAPEWTRGPRDSLPYPNLGDFTVLSIDPVASVGHLDQIARQAASSLPIRRYVALAYSSSGLPIESKPTHPYDFFFVRKGVPEPRLEGNDSVDSCVAILPNTHSVASRDPVRPAHPLPWDNCYLDATYGFPFPCRVTAINKDYPPVLPIPDSEVVRLNRCFHSQWSALSNLEQERGDDLPGALDLVEATLLHPASTAHSVTEPSGLVDLSPTDGRASPCRDTDNVSVIGSNDGSEHTDDASGSESEDSEDLAMFLNFEHMMFNTGELHDPVVNVWYDLDMVTEIVDPVHFLEDVKRIRIIMDEAEVRLGLRPDPAAADLDLGHANPCKDAREKSDGQSVMSHHPPEDVPSEPIAPPPPKLVARLRSYIRSKFSKFFVCARACARKLIFRRSKKEGRSKVMKP
ncbi:hypothetical protein PENSPDRAFT_686150 [Peniophora sp. CONT]|nr:hypothetical protein PENSPDRAFT_686150 [Peniophora sp. CONT]